MKAKNFKTGQEVRIKGMKGRFRYVKRNVVQNVKTGRVLAVNPEKIRSAGNFESNAMYFKWLILAAISVVIWATVIKLNF